LAEFIAPVVDWLIGVIATAASYPTWPEGLEGFAEVRKSWTGVCVNWPPVAVMPLGTSFDPEGQVVNEAHAFTIKFGVNGDDPDQVTVDAMAYMKALDDLIQAAAWDPALGLSRVFVSKHDYGPLFGKDGSFAKFPELHLEVEALEL
jgi:hypothetical protein